MWCMCVRVSSKILIFSIILFVLESIPKANKTALTVKVSVTYEKTRLRSQENAHTHSEEALYERNGVIFSTRLAPLVIGSVSLVRKLWAGTVTLISFDCRSRT